MSEPDVIRLDLPASFKYLNVVGACLDETLKRVDDLPEPESISHDIQLAVHEICTNIVRHAYSDRAPERIRIMLAVNPDSRTLSVELRDTGRSFNPSEIKEPDLSQPQEGGLGIFLARTLMDDVRYETDTTSNRWYLSKAL